MELNLAGEKTSKARVRQHSSLGRSLQHPESLGRARASHSVLEALLPKQTRDAAQHVKQRAKRHRAPGDTSKENHWGFIPEKSHCIMPCSSCRATSTDQGSSVQLLPWRGSCMTGMEEEINITWYNPKPKWKFNFNLHSKKWILSAGTQIGWLIWMS